jgi:hypothetical protein
MSERKDYTYDGHVTLKVTPDKDHSTLSLVEMPQSQTMATFLTSRFDDHIKNKVNDIVILAIEHMIPVNISCTLDGADHVLTVYIDYKTSKIHLPKDTMSELHGSDEMFRESILTYLSDQRDEVMRRYEEEFPGRNASEFETHTIPNPPQEEEED